VNSYEAVFPADGSTEIITLPDDNSDVRVLKFATAPVRKVFKEGYFVGVARGVMNGAVDVIWDDGSADGLKMDELQRALRAFLWGPVSYFYASARHAAAARTLLVAAGNTLRTVALAVRSHTVAARTLAITVGNTLRSVILGGSGQGPPPPQVLESQG